MFKLTIISMALVVSLHLGLSGKAAAAPTRAPAPGTVGTAAVARDLNAFGSTLLELAPADRNTVFSPYSLFSALALTYAGAKGETAAEMEKALHTRLRDRVHQPLSSLQDKLTAAASAGNTLLTANALWLQTGYSVSRRFLDLSRKSYHSKIAQLDFKKAPEAAVGAINRWTAEATNDKIRELFQPRQLSPDTRLVLTNAVYFKGSWQHPFELRNTKDLPFTLPDGSKVQVPTMSREGSYGYAENKEVQVLSIPYLSDKGAALSMTIVLPKKDADLKDLKQLKLVDALEPRQVRLFLPRFRIESTLPMKEPLMKMGMKRAFEYGAADFSGITGDKEQKLAVSDVVHKAYIDVNETGTEAAAASGVAIGVTMVRQSIEFRVDRPFLFAIQENSTGAVIFCGRVTDPRGP